MQVNFIKPLQFGYKSVLKTEWLKGNMPTVKKGIYGSKLTKDTITLEHLVPHSENGKTNLANLALAVDKNNWKRGSEPLGKFLTQEMFDSYCEQFKGIKLPNFDGDNYIELITQTVKRIIGNKK